MKHQLVRTNPKGEPFVGRCVACGEEGLNAYAARDIDCPNPAALTNEDAIMLAIDGAD